MSDSLNAEQQQFLRDLIIEGRKLLAADLTEQQRATYQHTIDMAERRLAASAGLVAQ